MSREFTSRRERDSYGRNLHKTPEYATNPHKAILDFILPYIEKVRVFPTKILVATYRQPERTEGGLILTDTSLDEDMYQGACGLVLKVGDAAYKDDATTTFTGFKVEPLEWITFRAAHGSARAIAGLHCRFLKDDLVEGVIEDPTLVW